jgi:hypothetical protein
MQTQSAVEHLRRRRRFLRQGQRLQASSSVISWRCEHETRSASGHCCERCNCIPRLQHMPWATSAGKERRIVSAMATQSARELLRVV